MASLLRHRALGSVGFRLLKFWGIRVWVWDLRLTFAPLVWAWAEVFMIPLNPKPATAQRDVYSAVYQGQRGLAV